MPSITTKTKRDPKYHEAKDVIREHGWGSVVKLQLTLRVSYPRAAEMINTMKEEGFLVEMIIDGVPKLVPQESQEQGESHV